MILTLLGAPGSGKGTLSEIICPKLNLLAVSTGDLLRNKMREDADFAASINDSMSGGRLVSDDIIRALVDDFLDVRIKMDKYDGLLFDGYPRTIEQAQYLDNSLKERTLKVNGAILLIITEEAIIDRITSRRVDRNTGKIYNLKTFPPPEGADLYQRPDDTEEVIKSRLAVYNETTAPLIDYYKNADVLFTIDGAVSRAAMEEEVNELMKQL